jgi:alpha-ketoglutarate-dependent taurine dioxygenase
MKTQAAFDILGKVVEAEPGTTLQDLDTDELKSLFKEEGFLIFRGFNPDTKAFEHFTDGFSDDYMDHRGGGSLREVINKDGDKTILSVSYNYDPNKSGFDKKDQKSFPLALHSDRSYTKTQPPLMWFCCVTPAKVEGETLICDGVQVAKALSPRTVEFFRNSRINYIRTYTEKEWQLWAQTDSLDGVRSYCDENELKLTVNPDNSITTESLKWAIVKPRWTDQDAFVNSMLLVQWQEDVLKVKRSVVRMEDGSEIPADIWSDVRAVTDEKLREIHWHPGDIAMLDNTRMLHGRREFSDPNRRIFVRMAHSVDW